MKSILSEQAKKEIRQTAKYIGKEFGKIRRDEFMQEIRKARRLIESNPNIGPVEPLLTELPGMYRGYVMNRLNKLVYRVSGDTIYIADFWDVRRNPQSLSAQVK